MKVEKKRKKEKKINQNDINSFPNIEKNIFGLLDRPEAVVGGRHQEGVGKEGCCCNRQDSGVQG